MLTLFSRFLKLSIDLFKQKQKQLLTLTFLSAAINLLFQSIQNFANNTNDATLKIIVAIGVLIALAPYIYYTSRLNIALILFINKTINKIDTTLEEVFKESKDLFSGYFWTGLKLVGLILIPVLVYIVTYIQKANAVFLTVITLAGIVLIIYLVLNYGMSIYVSVLQPGEQSYFNKSKTLFNTNHYFVVVLYLVVFLLIGANMLLAFSIPNRLRLFGFVELNLIVSSIVGAILSPITTSIFIYGYWSLERMHNKNGDVEESSLENDY